MGEGYGQAHGAAPGEGECHPADGEDAFAGPLKTLLSTGGVQGRLCGCGSGVAVGVGVTVSVDVDVVWV